MLISSQNKDFDAYYGDLAAYAGQGVSHEQATRFAFSKLLDTFAKPAGWTVILEQKLDGSRKRPDATLYDAFKIPRGYWEAKDTQDDLDSEIQRKIKLKYPLTNTIFEDTRRAVLYQNGQVALESDLRQPDQLAALLTRYFTHTDEQIEQFHAAIAKFKEDIPTLAAGLKSLIEDARRDNLTFAEAFEAFHTLCKGALNPAIRAEAIEEMLVQHLLTERLFTTVLDNSEFTKRNVIAAEIEKVITALTSASFSRREFLKRLDYFYVAIETEAKTITTYSEKQAFLNTVYERFFQGFSKDQADTHGIVYTPQEIVDFMCESVQHVLQTEFGTSLSAPGVVILDPCTGTGNFLVNLLRRILPMDLERKYRHELFANEVMLLPYYIASLNIEHAYYEVAKKYEAFDGICFTDTLDLAESRQLAFFSEENTERVQREKDAAVTVIIGNPPYNVGQQNENDNNKNRRYGEVDDRIRATYVKDSSATLHTKSYDAYVRFFRWATDRLGDLDGIVCYVTNNSFVDRFALDGMRKNLLQDFTQIYHLDLHGNVNINPKLSGTTHNVFGIKLSVGITIAIRKAGAEKFLKYYRVPEDWTRLSKLAAIKQWQSLTDVPWNTLVPDQKNAWLTEGLQADFEDFLPIASKEARALKGIEAEVIFKDYSNGINTARDAVAYDFDKGRLQRKVEKFAHSFNEEVERWANAGTPKDIDNFVDYSDIKWSRNLKSELGRRRLIEFDTNALRSCAYRPFAQRWLYHSGAVVDEPGTTGAFFPSTTVKENFQISLSSVGNNKPFQCLLVSTVADFHLMGDTKCFPLYTYALDGRIRRDNITDWALGQFQAKYGPDVTKPDIFHYVYALLHHPDYRERYKENLKRELPRIPLVDSGDGTVFAAYVQIGAELAALHVGYEEAAEYPLEQKLTPEVPFSWRVTKMRLSADKTAIKVNDSLTLAGIPPEAFAYRLGNRAALEWVLDQYQVTTDKRSGLVSDPNRADAPDYIARLVRRVITVSVETQKRVGRLPGL